MATELSVTMSDVSYAAPVRRTMDDGDGNPGLRLLERIDPTPLWL